MSIAELAPVTDETVEGPDDLAIMLTGGGARAAYQVGLLREIARHFPHLRFQIVTRVSAGAINAVFLAAEQGTLTGKVEQLTDLPHGLFNAGPLDTLLRDLFDCHIRCAPIHGIRTNLQSGRLKAVALIGLDYATGQSVRWVQGRDIDVFEGTNRVTLRVGAGALARPARVTRAATRALAVRRRWRVIGRRRRSSANWSTRFSCARAAERLQEDRPVRPASFERPRQDCRRISARAAPQREGVYQNARRI